MADPGRTLFRLAKAGIPAKIKFKNIYKLMVFPQVMVLEIEIEKEDKPKVEKVKKAIFSNNIKV